MLKVGVVGCGTIGGEICRAIDEGLVQATLVGISDVDLAKAENLARSLRTPTPVLSLPELIKASDLVVEAASKSAAPSIIRQALERSRDVMVMSVGGLLECAADLVALATRQGRKLYVPSGAIAGLDAIKGAMVGRVSKVTLTTRKPPRGLGGSTVRRGEAD